MKVSVCIPMYNESAVIEKNAKALYSYMSSAFDSWEVVCTDDGSTDGCAQKLESLALPNFRVISYRPNQGKGYAVKTAMLEATGEVRIFTDTDLAYGTDIIGRIAKMFCENPDCDIIIGSRNLNKSGYEGYTFLRRIVSKTYIKLLQLIGGFGYTDSQCGIKGFRDSAAKKIFPLMETRRWAFDFEALLIAGRFKMKIKEIPVVILNHGESKMNILSDSVKMFRDLLKIRRRVKGLDAREFI